MRALFCCWQKQKKQLKKTHSLTLAGQNGQIFLFKLTIHYLHYKCNISNNKSCLSRVFNPIILLNNKKCLQKCYIVAPLGAFIWSRIYNGSVFNKQLHVLLLSKNGPLVLISQFNNISNHLKQKLRFKASIYWPTLPSVR